jgi:polysaccharide biosynthesis/export protein
MKKLLCIFTFLILNHAAYAVEDVSLQYKLLAGDRVAISVWGEDTLNLKDIMVLPDGTISFPLAGNFQVVGYTTQQVEAFITEKLKEYLPAPKVTVVVTGVEGSRAYVVGKVLKPGPVLLNTPTTVLQAIAIAGALDRFADEDNIKVIRSTADGQQVFKVNYGELVKGKGLESNILLKAGDTVVVP